ncbi:MAG: uncharacterized protein Athens071416_576 [Parcubacteria group bacterium Athens0714_16]|nr:MAG: uncharacterized protein Athens071416_576 [Parcubacteria group bacterium Athens0714_16]
MRVKVLLLTTLLLFLPSLVLAFAVPEKPSSFVSDYAEILKPEEKLVLESKLSEFEKQTTNEIAVVTIKSLDGNTIENIAQEIFTQWGIGKKDKNNGVLLLISLEDRQTRIQTGYGVEPYLTDIGTSYIQSDVIAGEFKFGAYFSGINRAVDKMIEALGGQQIVPEGYSQNSNKPKFSFNFIIFILFAFQWVIAILARSKSWWAGGIFGGVVGLAIAVFFIGFSLITIFVAEFLLGFWVEGDLVEEAEVVAVASAVLAVECLGVAGLVEDGEFGF